MNKHLYNLTLGLAAAAAMSLASCADDVAAPGVPGQDGEGVWMSIDISRGSDPASRLTHSEDADGLNVAWEQDDYIYVYGWIEGEGRTYLGKLDYVKTVTDDADGCTASFAGQLTKAPGSENVTIYYAGKDANGNRRTMTAGQDLTVDYASQAGSFAAMANNDVMAINGVGVTISNNKVTSASTVVLDHQAAFAHFATDLAVGTQVTISASTITNQISFTSQGGISYGGNTTITASVQEGGDLYIAMLRVAGKPEITFTAGGKTVTLPAPSTDLAAGNYYRAGWTTEGGSEGIPVNFSSSTDKTVEYYINGQLDHTVTVTEDGTTHTAEAPTKLETLAANCAFFGWNTEANKTRTSTWDYSVGQTISLTEDVTRLYALVYDQTGNPLEKWAEGNLVYNKSTGKSTVSTNEYEGGSLYQWGRSYGFDDYSDALTWDSSIPSYHIAGTNISGYKTGMGFFSYYGTYYYKTGTLYDSNDDLKNSSYNDWFFMSKPSNYTSNIDISNAVMPLLGEMSVMDYAANVNADYWIGSNGGSTWAERAEKMNQSNVCPTGYRMPTYADYGEIFPDAVQLTSESSFKSTTTTSKIRQKGSKFYAINWSWTTYGSKQVLNIKTVVVPSDFAESNFSKMTWTADYLKAVDRKFPATGGIKAFYHVNVFQLNNSINSVPMMQPAPFGTWMCYLISSPAVGVQYRNFNDAGVNYQGGYWVSDRKAIATFRLDNGYRFGSENYTSYIGRITAPAQDAHAIRCIDTSKE